MPAHAHQALPGLKGLTATAAGRHDTRAASCWQRLSLKTRVQRWSCRPAGEGCMGLEHALLHGKGVI